MKRSELFILIGMILIVLGIFTILIINSDSSIGFFGVFPFFFVFGTNPLSVPFLFTFAISIIGTAILIYYFGSIVFCTRYQNEKIERCEHCGSTITNEDNFCAK
ncbi:MAG: hypothetical protein ACTSQZ_09200, partial [Candidatus Thorarchaeota archaeon]